MVIAVTIHKVAAIVHSFSPRSLCMRLGRAIWRDRSELGRMSAGRSGCGAAAQCALRAQALAEGQQVGEPFLAAPVDEVVLGARRPALGRPEAVAVVVAVQDPAVVGSVRTRHLQPCMRAHASRTTTVSLSLDHISLLVASKGSRGLCLHECRRSSHTTTRVEAIAFLGSSIAASPARARCTTIDTTAAARE